VWGLGINALTYALSAIFLIQIAGQLGRPAQHGPETRKSFRTDLSEGLTYVLRNRTLTEVMFGYLPSNFLTAFVSPYFVVYASVRFGGSALAYATLVAAMAAGSAVGGLLVGRFKTRSVAGWVMGIGLLVEGALIGVLAISGNLGVSALAALGDGLTIGFSNTVYYSTIQATVPGNILARVLAIGDFGSFAAIPAGLVVGGLVILSFGIGFAVAVASVGVLATAVVLLSLPDFRKFGEK